MTDRRLRVGLICAGQEAGGVERYVSSLARALVDRCQPVVLSVGDAVDPPALNRAGVETVPLLASEPGWRSAPHGGTRRRSAVAAAGRRLPASDITASMLAALRVAATGRNRSAARSVLPTLSLDVIHVHNGGHPASAVALGHLLAGADTGIPIRALTVHGTPRPRAAFTRSSERLLDRQLWDAATVVTAVSRATADMLVDLRGTPPELVHVVETAIEEVVPVPPAAARQRLGLSSEVPVVAMLADMRTGKRQDLLVRATEHLARRQPGVTVVLAGDGPDRGSLQRLVSRLGLNSRVLMPGRLPRELVLGAATVVVLLSDSEALPLSLIEAMSVGLPVLGSDVGGVAELITDDRTGVLIPEHASPAAVGAIIGDLLENEARRTRLGRAAKELVATRLSFRRMVDRYWELYASRSGSRPGG